MDPRKQRLLKLIIEHYIETAEPVGSTFLVHQADLDISAATVRNEMRELEEMGYLTHPHTSAGRIPTEKGYQHYVEACMELKPPKKNIRSELEHLVTTASTPEEKMKNTAKYIAEYAKSTVLVAFSTHSIYYTGMSNLFSQPEFHSVAHTVRMSSIFDHCEEQMEKLFTVLRPDGVQVLIGQSNPLGSVCSFIGTKIGKKSMFSVLGPMRMDYAKNIAVTEFIHDLFL